MINKKGQNLTLAILTGVMVFMAGMLILNHVSEDVSLSKTVGLDCSSDSISDGTKVTCLGVDLVIPILMVTIVSAAAGSILARFII